MKWTNSSIWLAVALLSGPAIAEVRNLTEDELNERATHIVVGVVDRVTSDTDRYPRGASHTEWTARITVKQAEKGDLEPGDAIAATYWTAVLAPDEDGSIGQRQDARTGATVRLYLRKDGELFQVLLPNGLDELEKPPNSARPKAATPQDGQDDGSAVDPLYGRIAVFVNLLVYILIRWPHGNRLKTLAVNDDRKGRLEIALLIAATLGTTLLPLIWIMFGFPAFADYSLHKVAFAIGIVALLIGHWLFYRSHRDLGIYWSPTLQMREDHELMSTGIYSRIRHPMYAAMTVQGIAQLLILPNWIAGPAWLVTFGLLYLVRVGHEEQMMLERFGDQYTEYMQHTGRLLPRLRRAK